MSGGDTAGARQHVHHIEGPQGQGVEGCTCAELLRQVRKRCAAVAVHGTAQPAAQQRDPVLLLFSSGLAGGLKGTSRGAIICLSL
jgi:hypothetical protein